MTNCTRRKGIAIWVLLCSSFFAVTSACSRAGDDEATEICKETYGSVLSEFKGGALTDARLIGLIDALGQAMSDCPTHAGLRTLMADAQLSAGRNELALRYAEEALAIDPDDAAALHVAGSILFTQGRVQEALPLLQKSIELEPLNIEYRINMCSTLESIAEYDSALTHCSAAIELGRSTPSPIPYYLRSRINSALGNREDALKDLDTARSLGFAGWE